MTDFLNEKPNADEDDFFAGTPAAMPARGQPAQPAQPPARSFIPEGYEPPQKLQEKLQRRNEEVRRLNMKMSRARETDPERNPYAVKGQNGKLDFDQFGYDADKRTYDSLTTDVQSLNWKLQNAASVSQRLEQGIQGAARKMWQNYEARVPKHMRDEARKRYAANVQHLLGAGHFQAPGYETQEAIDRAFHQIITGVVGQLSIDGTPQGNASGASVGGKEEPEPKAPSEYEGWHPDAVRMVEAALAAGNNKRETLADRAKREAEAARARLDSQMNQGGEG